MKEKSIFDAIFILATIIKSPSVNNLREQTEKISKDFVFQSIMPFTFINEMGRTIATRPPKTNDVEDQEAYLLSEMFRNSSLHRHLAVVGSIEPARKQICYEHRIRLNDMMQLVTNNAYVPPDREFMFAKGLLAGFEGDFLVASHLLIPQLENSIRFVLNQNGNITSGLDKDGIQDEFDLNRILSSSEFKETLEGIFGEDTVFDLRGLLVERYGANLRNDIAHGLLGYSSFNSISPCYIWWMVLRLCCLPVIHELVNNKKVEAEIKEDS